MILLAVGHLGPDAYGLTIRQHIEAAVGGSISVGAIYVPLERLAERGYLTTIESPPTPTRGGRRKKLYCLTARGVAALEEAQRVQQLLRRQYIGGPADA